MSRVTVSGVLVASSHLFYLSKENKVSILRLKTESDTVYVLCSLSRSLSKKTREFCREMLVEPKLDQSLRITGLKAVTISKPSVHNLFQLTKSSQITRQELAIAVKVPEGELVSYRGIVTSVYSCLRSVFTLDKRIRSGGIFFCGRYNGILEPFSNSRT